MKKVEILAPAGEIDCLIAAIAAGANAVYLGINAFNARMNATNFTRDNLAYWVKHCHCFQTKVYLTLNTIIKENELNEVIEVLKCAENANVDAIIFQDLSIITLAKEYAPSVSLHASTQLAIHNFEGAIFLQKLGISRVVLSRETLYSDIIKIKSNTNLEVEYFIHGALCVSFSGNCYASSFINGGSGNRGRCLQTCRLPYTFSSKTPSLHNEYLSTTIKQSGNKNNARYLLSASDINSVKNIEKLLDIGIDSLKIEGRMRSPQYVYSTVSLYRKVIDLEPMTDVDAFLNKAAFNRGGNTQGYNHDSDRELMSVNSCGNFGAPFGTISKIIDDNNYIIRLSDPRNQEYVKVGDGVKVFSNGNELGGGKILQIYSAPYGDSIHLTLSGDFPIDSEVRVTSLNSFNIIEKKIPIELIITAKINSPLKVTVICENINDMTVTSSFILENSENSGERIIIDELKKLGETIFISNEVTYIGDEFIFIPKSVLKNLKNEIITLVKNELLTNYNNEKSIIKSNTESNALSENIQATAAVQIGKPIVDSVSLKASIPVESTQTTVTDNFIPQRLLEFCDELPSKIMQSPYVFSYFPTDFSKTEEIVAKIRLTKSNITSGRLYLRLPNIARGKDIDNIRKILDSSKEYLDGIHAENLYAVTLAREYKLKYICGYFMNITNSHAVKILQSDMIVFSSELSLFDMNAIKSKLNKKTFFSYSYGNFPLMTLSHCPLKVNSYCNCNDCKYDGTEGYKDRMASFQFHRIKNEHCYFYLLNSVPHYVKSETLNNIVPYLDCKNHTQSGILEAIEENSILKFTKGYYNKPLK